MWSSPLISLLIRLGQSANSVSSSRHTKRLLATFPPSMPKTGPRQWKRSRSISDRSWENVKSCSHTLYARMMAFPKAITPQHCTLLIQDEMITRTPHYSIAADRTKIPDPIYLINRENVWDIISKITREHLSWTYVKPAERSRDGRMAFMNLDWAKQR